MEEHASTVQEQINLMHKNGIEFKICPREEAADFLTRSNFFFKVKAFDKNFDKFESNNNPRHGKYVHLDFAYLVDLSRKDAVLRELVLDLALDLEHYLKVAVNRVLMESNLRVDLLVQEFFSFSKEKALNQIARASSDEAVDTLGTKLHELSIELLQKHSNGAPGSEIAPTQAHIFSIAYDLCNGIDCDHIERSLQHLGSSHYSRKLVKKYGSVEVMKPWHFMEMASFGDVIAFYKFLFFDSEERHRLKHCRTAVQDTHNAQRIKRLLFPAKTLRNAAAHNDCLLNDLKRRMREPLKPIYKYLLEHSGIPKPTIDRSWQTPAAHDYSSLLICYELIVPNGETKLKVARRMVDASATLSQNLSYYRGQDEVFCALKLIAKLTECFSKRWQNS